MLGAVGLRERLAPGMARLSAGSGSGCPPGRVNAKPVGLGWFPASAGRRGPGLRSGHPPLALAPRKAPRPRPSRRSGLPALPSPRRPRTVLEPSPKVPASVPKGSGQRPPSAGSPRARLRALAGVAGAAGRRFPAKPPSNRPQIVPPGSGHLPASFPEGSRHLPGRIPPGSGDAEGPAGRRGPGDRPRPRPGTPAPRPAPRPRPDRRPGLTALPSPRRPEPFLEPSLKVPASVPQGSCQRLRSPVARSATRRHPAQHAVRRPGC